MQMLLRQGPQNHFFRSVISQRREGGPSVTMCALYILLRRRSTQAATIGLQIASRPLQSGVRNVAESLSSNSGFLTLQLQFHCACSCGSVCKGDFKLYISVLTHIIPWFFAMDRINYSRWLPIHLRDMTMLPETHPEIADVDSRREGNFVSRV